MKSVLISIKPKWCELIAEGKKTVEVRKSRPKCETPFKCYIYCTKKKDFVLDGEPDWGGKVIGEFVCDDISEIHPNDDGYGVNQYIFDAPIALTLHGDLFNPVCDQTCLSFDELKQYLGAKTGYSWHISDLVIYDKPKALSEFSTMRFCRACADGYAMVSQILLVPFGDPILERANLLFGGERAGAVSVYDRYF